LYRLIDYPKQRVLSGALVLLILAILQGSWVYAANFDIKPIKIVLDEKVKLEKLTLKNVSDTAFPIQVTAYEWSQDEKGDDVYTETKDIILFPKILSIQPREEKLIRIGTNVKPGMREKTYRIYVEEMPSPERESQGATIRLFMKIGIPVFINPPRIEDRPDIRAITMKDGKVGIDVSNGGNSHFMVTGVNVQGEDGEGKGRFNRDIGGWYLLSGSSKVYETSIPQEACGAITNLTVELKTNKTTIKRKVPVENTMCGGPQGLIAHAR